MAGHSKAIPSKTHIKAQSTASKERRVQNKLTSTTIIIVLLIEIILVIVINIVIVRHHTHFLSKRK